MLLLCSCKETYPKAHITSIVEDFCQSKYKLRVTAELRNDNLIAYASIPNLLDDTGNIARSSSNHLDHLLSVLSRVGMSTDAPLQFVTLVVMDSGSPNRYLRIVRHISDLRKMHRQYGEYSAYPFMEFFLRMDIQVFSELPDVNITLYDFMSRQLVRRIEKVLPKEQILTQVHGFYEERTFTVVIDGLVTSRPLEKAIPVSLKEFGKIVKGYGIKDFSRIVIESSSTGETLVWEKNHS